VTDTQLTFSGCPGFTEGDQILVAKENGFWKTLWCWIFQLPMSRHSSFVVLEVNSSTCMTIERE